MARLFNQVLERLAIKPRRVLTLHKLAGPDILKAAQRIDKARVNGGLSDNALEGTPYFDVSSLMVFVVFMLPLLVRIGRRPSRLTGRSQIRSARQPTLNAFSDSKRHG